MSGSARYLLNYLWLPPFVINVVATVMIIRLLRRSRRRLQELQPRGRCPVCERLKRDHTVDDIEACLQRAQAEAAQEGRIVIPVTCPTCKRSAFIAAAATCGGCGKPLLLGEMADVW